MTGTAKRRPLSSASGATADRCTGQDTSQLKMQRLVLDEDDEDTASKFQNMCVLKYFPILNLLNDHFAKKYM